MRWIGKGDQRVAAVFGNSRHSCRDAVFYLRKEVPEVPVFLYSTVEPLPDTAVLCERVTVCPGSLRLLLAAERQLWSRWVALSVGVWDGARGPRLLKWAPFLLPPFRVLLLNSHGDFLPGTPRQIAIHGGRALRDSSNPLCRGVRYAIAGGVRKLLNWLLLAASSMLRAAGYPHRQWFQRRTADRGLQLTSHMSSNRGIAVFTQTTAQWDGAALEKFARSTNARWILWHRRECESPNLADMMAPFAEPGAFAVSQQTHFRAWKPLLFPTAPFRTLQRGEAAQVMAPLGPQILVDRQNLLEVGIPRCLLADTAWMWIFWKAAAAGWRAFSIGQNSPLVEQPDLPMPETEFCIRLLARRAVRALRPAEPELSSGSISFSPTHPPAPSGRLRVLLVTPFLPFPLSHGGAVRIYNLCRSLSNRVDFVLITLRERDEWVDYVRLQEVFREVYVVDIDERPSADLDLPDQVRNTQSAPLRALIASLVERWDPDILQIEYTHMAAFRTSAPEVPALLVEHDLTFSLYRQFAEDRPTDAAHREYQRWMNFERHWLSIYDGVWTVSDEDRQRAVDVSGRSAEQTFAIPNGVDVRRFIPDDATREPIEILYVGSFRHLPNVLGFDNLRREIMPRVWSEFPEARLRVIAGKDYERYWNGPCDSRIALHGFVEDLRPHYASASLVVVPLGVSAGTNIKVLEAMACGKAVVSTTVGCAGLGLQDGVDIVIRDGWDDFSASLQYLLAAPEIRARLGERARRTAEARFSWTAIADQAYRSYLALCGRAASAARQAAGD